MHDHFEGVCCYDLTNLIHSLIFQNQLFSLETLNAGVQLFNYTEIENSNKPPLIKIEHLNTNFRISVSEMLCFTRYLGLMIGDLIAEGLEVWEIWIKLCEIVDVLMASSVHKNDSMQFKILVDEHHKLYIKYFGHLKPKHHHMVHYLLILKKSGPLHHIWSMRAEQKHRESKLTANVSCSFKNMLKTLMFKNQLRLGHILNSPDNVMYCYGPLTALQDNEFN